MPATRVGASRDNQLTQHGYYLAGDPGELRIRASASGCMLWLTRERVHSTPQELRVATGAELAGVAARGSDGATTIEFAGITHEVRQASPARQCFGALLLLAISSLLTACGGEITPAGGSLSGGAAGATLSWDSSPSQSVIGYRIYYGNAPGTYVQPMGGGVNAGNVTTFAVTGLTSGTRYYFAATAYDASSNESNFSNEVFVDTP